MAVRRSPAPWLVLAAAIATGGAVAWHARVPTPSAAAADADADAGRMPVVQAPRGAPAASRVARAPAAAPVSQAAPASVSVSASLAAQVDRWRASADPADAMRAYTAVERCLLARRREHLPPERFAGLPIAPRTAAETCADLRSDQVQDRLRSLERAAQAGEPDAAIAFIEEGPGGDGLLQDLDATPPPATPGADWRARRDAYIDRGLARCDLVLVSWLATVGQADPQDGAAMAYWYGRLTCPRSPPRAQALVPLADDPVGQAWLRRLPAGGTSLISQ